MIAFTRGVPDPAAFPLDELERCAQEAMALDHSTFLPYASSRGFPLLRGWVAETNGGNPDQVIISHGALQILDFIASAYAPNGATAPLLPMKFEAISIPSPELCAGCHKEEHHDRTI